MQIKVTPVTPPIVPKPTFGDLKLGDLFAYTSVLDDDHIPYKVFMKIDAKRAWDFKANGSFHLDSNCEIRRATGELNVQMID